MMTGGGVSSNLNLMPMSYLVSLTANKVLRQAGTFAKLCHQNWRALHESSMLGFAQLFRLFALLNLPQRLAPPTMQMHSFQFLPLSRPLSSIETGLPTS